MSGTSTEAYFENSGPCAPRFGQAGVKGKEPGHSAKSHLTASALLKVLRVAFHDQESVLGPCMARCRYTSMRKGLWLGHAPRLF